MKKIVWSALEYPTDTKRRRHFQDKNRLIACAQNDQGFENANPSETSVISNIFTMRHAHHNNAAIPGPENSPAPTETMSAFDCTPHSVRLYNRDFCAHRQVM